MSPLLENETRTTTRRGQGVYFTKAAEKQLAALPSDKRLAAVRFLLTPVRRWRSEKLSQFQPAKVRRAKIGGGGAVRLVYCICDGKYCVVFLDEHDAYDTFLRSWDGRVRGQLIPLSQSEVAMKISKKNHAHNGHASNGRASGDMVVSTPVCDTSAAPELLFHGLMSTVAHALDQQVSQNLESVVELVCESLMEGVRERLAEGLPAMKSVERLKSDLGQRLDRSTAALQTVQEAVEGLAERTDDKLDVCRNELTEVSRKQDEALGAWKSHQADSSKTSHRIENHLQEVRGRMKGLIRTTEQARILMRRVDEQCADGFSMLDKKLSAVTKVICERMEDRHQRALQSLEQLAAQTSRSAELTARTDQLLNSVVTRQQRNEEHMLALVEQQRTELRSLQERVGKSRWSVGLGLPGKVGALLRQLRSRFGTVMGR